MPTDVEPPRPPRPAVRVDRLRASDVAPYRALVLHAYAASPDAFTSTPEERAAQPDAWWRARICDPNGLSQAFGAFEGQALLGTVTVEFASRSKTLHKALIIGMFVHASARGRGIGRALLQAALEEAQSRPATRVVTLTVTQGNDAAIALYESCGFRTFGVEPMAIATPAGYRAKVHMWRELPAKTPR